MSLTNYLTDTASLLHDGAFLFSSRYQLTRWVNDARDQVCLDSACLRALAKGQTTFGNSAVPGTGVPGGAIPGQPTTTGFFTINGQELYPYTYANQYVTQENRGFRAVIEVSNVAVSWGGAVRPVQNWMPWDELQAYARGYNIGVFSYPAIWSESGVGEAGKVWLWPVPSNAQEMEWDCFCVPTPLYSDNDYDAIPGIYQRAVQFYAAHLGFLAQRQFQMADAMLSRYVSTGIVAAGASARQRTRNMYVDWTSW